MSAPVEIGEVLAGKYRVERVLGVGGMGVVVAAWHIELEAMVALKFLLPDILENATAIERFLREARAAVKLKSENTCQVRDVGRLENGAPYIVMEYLEGNDLLAELAQQGPLPVHVAASYVTQACKAMTEAHAVGIVHRDLKPQNLFRTQRGDGTPLIKVLDFGIAKLRLQDGSATHTAVIMGSPAYMAPEQARSAKHADARADIYSLGVILYQLTTGRLPFSALEKGTQDLSLTEILLSVQMDEPTPLRAFYPNAPAGWEDVVMRAMSKDPQTRIRDAATLAEALAPFTNPHYGQRSTPLPFQAPTIIASQPPSAPASIPKDMPTAMTGYQSVVTGAPANIASLAPHTNTTLSSAVHAGPSIAPTEPPRKKKWAVPLLALAVVVVAGVSFAAVKAGSSGDAVEPAKEPAKDPVTEPTGPVKEPAKEPTKEPAKEPAKQPVNEPVADPKPEAKPEVAAKPEATPEVDVKPEVATKKAKKPKPLVKADAKPETVSKPEPKPEPKPDVKPDPKKPDPKKPCRSDDVVCQFGNGK